MGLDLDAWWREPEYKVCGTFQTRGYFILRKLHELDPARFNTVMTNLYHEQEKKSQDITKVESGPEGIKDVQVKMGKWR